MSSRHHKSGEENLLQRILHLEEENRNALHEIQKELDREHPTPTSISFTEHTMNPTEAGQSQVFTGVLSPAGSTYPAGTTFTVTSNDPAVSPTVDPTGLIVSVTYPSGWVESTTTPLAFAYSSSVFVPVAPGTATQITATITPSAPSAGTPNAVAFSQTT